VGENCRVDFYVLQDVSQSAEMVACQLALKSWEQGNRTLVAMADQSAADRVDALMWEHPQGRFLPHAGAARSPDAPILIGTLDQLETSIGEVLINLTPQVVDRPQRYARLLEVVSADPGLKQASREKFRAYRSLGLEPVTHSLGRT
jgi:DNA polymerase-3 subunit chi